MYAIIRSGSRQYRAEIGKFLDVERLSAPQGSQIAIDDILFLRDGEETQIGQPRLDGIKVLATIVEQTRGPKVQVFKYRQRTSYRRKSGHRQYITRLRIDDIQIEG